MLQGRVTSIFVVHFSYIKLDEEYDRPTLAKMWGYDSFRGFAKGVFSPRDQNLLVFFVTKEKQESLTQYEDHIENDTLYWEGEQKHGTDARIVSKRDVIHLFYRDRHHSNFVYKGRLSLGHYQLLNDRPSRFVFDLIDKHVTLQNIVKEIKESYLTETEKDAIIKSRVGQGLFRKKAIDLWRTCSVTGFAKKNLLIASHIKPWKGSTNDERITSHNSLLLLPTLDRLFDKGYISFETGGKIMISSKINLIDLKKANITTDMRLREVPSVIQPFLEHHHNYVFDIMAK